MAEKVINSKTEWIHSAFDVMGVIEHLTSNKKVSFFTSMGLIVGERDELIEYNLNEETFVDQIKSNEGKINVNSFIESFLNNRNIPEDIKVDQRDRRLYLKNVTIYLTNNSNPIMVDAFVLFVDQVIGVIPGEVKF